jgi:hypothetical protein
VLLLMCDYCNIAAVIVQLLTMCFDCSKWGYKKQNVDEGVIYNSKILESIMNINP